MQKVCKNCQHEITDLMHRKVNCNQLFLGTKLSSLTSLLNLRGLVAVPSSKNKNKIRASASFRLLSFKVRGNLLTCILFHCLYIFRFTSGATPANLLASSMADQCFFPHYFWDTVSELQETWTVFRIFISHSQFGTLINFAVRSSRLQFPRLTSRGTATARPILPHRTPDFSGNLKGKSFSKLENIALAVMLVADPHAKKLTLYYLPLRRAASNQDGHRTRVCLIYRRVVSHYGNVYPENSV